MRSERKWKLSYVDASSECSDDNEIAEVRKDLKNCLRMVQEAHQSVQEHRQLNE